MQEPGGFLWWYLDLIDEQGDGLVFIWFAGLPFLPDPDPQTPACSRPGLSLARYRGGRCEDYFLQEYPPEALQLASSGSDLDLGACRVRWSERDARLNLRVDLDLPIPGSHEHLSGSILVNGHLSQHTRREEPASKNQRNSPASRTDDPTASHSWHPLMTATRGVAELRRGSQELRLEGRAYVDSNASAKPLTALGIDNWRWGRIAFPDRELIYYFVASDDGQPDIQLVLEVLADGSVRSHDCVQMCREKSARSIYGPSYARVIRLRDDHELDIEIRVQSLVDDGPFYLRFIVEGIDHQNGEKGLGFAELVLPKALGKPWQQPFIRMRCHQIAGPNSIWLPLFCGPSQTRARRLFRSPFIGNAKPRLPSPS